MRNNWEVIQKREPGLQGLSRGYVPVWLVQERRKKEREVEEKRLAAERAAEDERRKTAEVSSD